MAQDGEEPGANVAASEPGEASVGAKIRFLRQIFGLGRVAGQVIGGAVKRRGVDRVVVAKSVSTALSGELALASDRSRPMHDVFERRSIQVTGRISTLTSAPNLRMRQSSWLDLARSAATVYPSSL